MHRHHIVPRHVGGNNSGTVLLTIPEHAEEHRKLWEAHGRWQDYLAWKTLSGMINKEEAIRIAQNEGRKIAIRNGSPSKGGKAAARNGSNRGKKRTIETRARMSEARLRSGHSPPWKGGNLPLEMRQKISVARKAYLEKNVTSGVCAECGGDLIIKTGVCGVAKPRQFCGHRCRQRDWKRKNTDKVSARRMAKRETTNSLAREVHKTKKEARNLRRRELYKAKREDGLLKARPRHNQQSRESYRRHQTKINKLRREKRQQQSAIIMVRE